MDTISCMDSFLPVVREWFLENIGKPSAPQQAGWPLISEGKNVLLCAPTGSGKTLAAFLKCMDRLYRLKASGTAPEGIRVVYISPLKALNNDIYRNLELPLKGIERKAQEMGIKLPSITVAVRTGDTPQKERAAMLKKAPDILITTPESLFIMLTSPKTAGLFKQVEYIIADEIHSVYATKRGVHFAVSLERLSRMSDTPVVRIGLSATVNPLEEAAGFLGGLEAGRNENGSITYKNREVCIINCDGKRKLEIVISSPVKNFKEMPEGTVWTSIYSQILTLVRAHKSTLVFVNNRRLAELVSVGINTLAGEQIVKTHHGSISKEMRLETESRLKSGELPCLVATSTLEMGIDIGSIELVIQVGTPDSASQALQRIGRSGHRMDAISKGNILPRTRGDLIKAAFTISQALDFDIEKAKVPTSCLDVLAQQVTSIACQGEISAEELYELVKCSWPYRDLPFRQLENILEMLGYPSPEDEPDLIKPRIFYDRVGKLVKGNNLGRMMCLLSGGTIPDKGNYAVYLSDTDLRLGELEEEFVFESRLGDRFYLGSTIWKIDKIDHDRVWVSQTDAAGGKIPFWIGDKKYRNYETGLRYGAFLRELKERISAEDYYEWAGKVCGLDRTAAENLKEFIIDQINISGKLHNDRLMICEYFSDEAGERRIMLHTPFGGRIHAVMATVLHDRLVKLLGCMVEYIFNDDGVLLHIVGSSSKLTGIVSLLTQGDPEEEVFSGIAASPVFNMSLRYNLSKSLLLSAKARGNRKPHWIQRLRSAEIAQRIIEKPDHPVVAETFREVLSDIFDIKGFNNVINDIKNGRVGVHEIATGRPSPFTSELLFNFWQMYQYVADLPVAERRNQLLINDREFVRMAVGLNGEYELLDERAINHVRKELARLKYGRKITCPDELYYFLYAFGELPVDETCGKQFKEISENTLNTYLYNLEDQCRAFRITVGARKYWTAAEDYPAFCSVAGIDKDRCIIIVGKDANEKAIKASDWLNSYIISIKAEPLASMSRLIRRFARYEAVFTAGDIIERYGAGKELVEKSLDQVTASGEIIVLKHSSELTERVYCHSTVYERIRKKTVEYARKDIKPRSREDYCSFLLEYHGICEEVTAPEEILLKVVERLKGLYMPAAWWEDFVFPARIKGYEPRILDYMCSTGAIKWVGRTNGSTEEIAFYPAEEGIQGCAEELELEEFEARALEILTTVGACFIKDFARQAGVSPDELAGRLERLVWNGRVANDSFAIARYYLEYRKKNSPWTKYGAYPAVGRWYIPEKQDDQSVNGIREFIDELLDRYGLICKEIVISAKGRYKWGEVYTYLKSNELLSGIKRGYFVSGLSAVQFARDAEIERFRLIDSEKSNRYMALSACDPANPYRDLFKEENRSVNGKNTGTAIVFRQGAPVLLVREYGSSFDALSDDASTVIDALQCFIQAFCTRTLWVSRKNLVTELWGEISVEDCPYYEKMLELGYDKGYKGITLWKKSV